MEIKKVEYGENEHCFRIRGLSPSWGAIAEYFNMPYKKFEKLMVKYGAIKPEPGRGHIWKTAQERDNFLNSKEFLPYKIMAKLTK